VECGYKGLVCLKEIMVELGMQNMNKGLTAVHCTKIGDDSLAKRIQNAPKIFRPNLSAQAQKLGVLEKKVSLGVRSPCPVLLWVVYVNFGSRQNVIV
jgi:hypothetical protein